MFEPRNVMAFLALVGLLSCASQQESAVDTYFTAVQSGDTAARAAVSAMDFPGKVVSWDVLEVGPESVAPFALPDLTRKVRDAKREIDYHLEKKGNLLRDNARVYAQVQARIEKDPEAQLKGDLAEFQSQLKEMDEKEKDLEQAVQEASRALEKERTVTGISIMGTSVTELLEGDVAMCDVRVRVTTDAGEKPYKLALRKYDLVNKQTQARQRSRWAIYDITEEG